jgi:OmcA/MtrC family decaheme c-type cytochrome
MTSPTPLPTPPALPVACPPGSGTACPPIANVGVVIEGHPGVVLSGWGSTGKGAEAIPVTSAVGYGNVGGGAPVARRTVVDIAKCDVCHNLLALHGSNRNNNPQACVACHNPASTDVSERVAPLVTATTPGIDGLWEESIDFKYMIHALHDGADRSAAGIPLVIYGFRGSINNFGNVVYPSPINRCDTCHENTTTNASYYPVSDSAVQATTFTTGLAANAPQPAVPDPTATSANMTVCSACHSTYNWAATAAHIAQNGGSTSVKKDAEGRTIPGGPASLESCSVCHGPGGIEDLRVAHHLPPPTAGN